jgi:hypothetical protein
MEAAENARAAENGLVSPFRSGGVLSISILQSAIGLLQLRHGIADQHRALGVMQDISRRLGVSLHWLADALVSGPPSSWGGASRNPHAVRPPAEPPQLPFPLLTPLAYPARADVMRALLDATMERAGTDRGTVQLLDPIHHGLTIAGHTGFDTAFVDFFGYVDDAGSACADAMRNRSQTLVADIDTSPVFTEPARAVVYASGVRSVVSTPLRDHDGAVRGMVSVHYGQRTDRISDAVLAQIQRIADDCGRWLHWYDAAMVPGALASVHAAAARAGNGRNTRRYRPDSPRIVTAGRVLMDRYGLDAPSAAEALVRLADRRGVSIAVLVAQLLDG